MSDIFDEMQKGVRRLSRKMDVPINLPLDDDGYLDRTCPHPNCRAAFKVLFVDWEAKVGADAHCPICGHVRKSSEWHTAEQKKSVERQALAAMQKKVDAALAEAARRTRPVTYGGLVHMALSFKPGAPIVTIPIAAAKAMQLKCVCEKCGCRYASVGFAFFCPACGDESVVSRIAESFDAVRENIEALPQIRAHLAATVGEDVAMDTERAFVEDKIVSMAGLFQRFADCLYRSISAARPPPKNVFQRLDEGSELWAAATGTNFSSILQPAEYQRMKVYFQRRHLLAHCNGIVDLAYLQKSGDTTFSSDQRLVVSKADVLDMCNILSRLCSGMRASVNPPSSPSP